MKKTLKRVEPLQFAKISGVFCLGFTLIWISIFMAIECLHTQSSGICEGSPLAIVISIIYAVMAFPAGIVAAWVYNLTAKLLGGVRVDIE